MANKKLYISAAVTCLLDEPQMKSIVDVCASYDFELQHISSIDEMKELLPLPEGNLFVTDSDFLLNLITELSFIPNNETILLTNKRGDNTIIDHIDKLYNLKFIIAVQSPEIMRSIFESIFEFSLQTSTSDVLKRFFEKNNLVTMSFSLNISEQRHEIQKQVINFFTLELERNKDKNSVGISIYPKNLGEIVDEFLMNAIWDANPKRQNSDRTEIVHLEKNENITIDCVSDGTLFCLSVTDIHGTFSQQAFLGPIRSALAQKTMLAKINEGPGGAGLGLFLTLQKTSFLCFEITKNKYSKVSAVVRCDQSYKELQKKPRTLLLFYKE